MRFTIQRDALSSALDTLGVIMQSKSPIPILSHVYVAAADSSLSLATHNLNQCVSVALPADVEARGSICIPYEPLANLLAGSAKGSHAKIEVVDNSAKITIGRSRYSLGTISADDFPPLLEPIDAVPLVVASADLLGMIDATEYAIMADSLRPSETAIFLFDREGHLACIASKGASISLAWSKEKYSNLTFPKWEASRIDDAPIGGLFLSKEVIRGIKSLGGEQFNLMIGKNVLSVQTGSGAKYAAKMIEGHALNYKRIPQIPATDSIVERAGFLQALKRLSAIQDAKATSAIKIGWEDGGELKLWLRNGFDGKATGEELLEATVSGSREVACNLKYLAEAIDRMESDVIRICVDGPGDPIHIVPQVDGGRHAVILPMRY